MPPLSTFQLSHFLVWVNLQVCPSQPSHFKGAVHGWDRRAIPIARSTNPVDAVGITGVQPRNYLLKSLDFGRS
jgi:hypothetical protein